MADCSTDLSGCTDEELSPAFETLRDNVAWMRELGIIPDELKPVPLSVLQWAIVRKMKGTVERRFSVPEFVSEHYRVAPFVGTAGGHYKDWRRKYRSAHVAVSRAVQRLERRGVVEDGRLTQAAVEALGNDGPKS
jgi:hypothetical protein